MVEASQWYSLISVGGSSLALLAAAYVVRKIPNRRAGDTFVLAMVFFVFAVAFACILRRLTLFATLFMSTALAVLVRTLLRNKDPIVRKQAILMTAGVVIHGTGAESYAYLRIFADLYPPPYLTITAFAMAVLFAVAVLRYRMFVVTPQKEEPVGVPRRFDLKAGHAYG